MIAPQERPFEYMLNALRLVEGFTQHHFEARTGLSADVLAGTLADASRRGLLVRRPDGWRPTELGLRFLNDLQRLFLPD